MPSSSANSRARQIDGSSPEFHKAIGFLRASRAWELLYILEVQEEQSVAVFCNGIGRIAATLKIVGHIQLQL